MKALARLLRESRGVAAVEFAIIAPVMALFLVGLAQLGIVFMANAGLRNAVAKGARLATIYPTPSDQQLTQQMMENRFGLQDANLSPPTFVRGGVDGANYVDITVRYTVPLDFGLFRMQPITLVQSRRAFVSQAR